MNSVHRRYHNRYVRRTMFYGIIFLFVGILLSVTVVSSHYEAKISKLEEQQYEEIERLSLENQHQYERYKTAIDRMININGGYRSEIESLETRLVEQEDAHRAQLERLNASTPVRTNTKSMEQFKVLQKYAYVFQMSGRGNYVNSTMTVDLILYIDQVCKEMNVNPHWMMFIYSVESWWNASAVNSSSGASGLGQVMPSTGRDYWTNVFNRPASTYSRDLLFDPYTNVEITVKHIQRSLDSGQNMRGALNQYSGGGGSWYYDTVVSRAAAAGVTLSESATRYN